MDSFTQRLVRRARRYAIRAGLIAPAPLRYPFRETMAENPEGRGPYRWGTLCAAALGKHLGYPRISVIEFGVAGGNGLVALENIAKEVGRGIGVEIDVYGFDTGQGLTKPQDHRDLPQLWSEGFYKMDEAKLRSRLNGAQLVLGPVGETVPAFLKKSPAPVGFVSFDLDLYSSTVDAFRLLEGSTDLFLPRVQCYFDDLIGFSHGDFNGERLAISEFNQRHAQRKISQIYGLRHILQIDRVWTEMMYMFHAFDHPRYNDFDGSNWIGDIPLN
jgi:hypothetical protein